MVAQHICKAVSGVQGWESRFIQWWWEHSTGIPYHTSMCTCTCILLFLLSARPAPWVILALAVSSAGTPPAIRTNPLLLTVT
jgi:hypothetical protein